MHVMDVMVRLKGFDINLQYNLQHNLELDFQHDLQHFQHGLMPCSSSNNSATHLQNKQINQSIQSPRHLQIVHNCPD
jgi:hypothetical protein